MVHNCDPGTSLIAPRPLFTYDETPLGVTNARLQEMGLILPSHGEKRTYRCTWPPVMHEKPLRNEKRSQPAAVHATRPLQFVAIDIMRLSLKTENGD